MLNGRNIIVMAGSSAIGAAKSCDVTIDGDLIEIASTSSGKAKTFIGGRYTWSVIVNCLLTTSLAPSSQTQQWEINKSYTLKLYKRDSPNSDVITGTAILKNYKITATVNNLVQMSCSFQGTGELTY